MAVESIDFDDLPEEDFAKAEKMVTLSFKVSEEARDMFAKISHRERRNMSALGGIILEEWMNDYIEKYKKSRTD